MNAVDAKIYIRNVKMIREMVDRNGRWDIVYDALFEDGVATICNRIHRVEYCDPDTSYEEDVMAWLYANEAEATDIAIAYGLSHGLE